MTAPAVDQIRLIAFDVDGTLITHARGEVVWQLFHARFNGDPNVGWARYKDFKEGRITYTEWVDLDVSGWKTARATRGQMVEIIQRELQVVDGARQALAELRARGFKLAIISGTLDIVVSELIGDIQFDHVFTNRLVFDQHGLLDSWVATPYDGDGKARALERLSREEGVPLSQCAFVGDHVNDLAVLETAGLGVAFMPKTPEVASRADVVVDTGDLRDVLPIFPP